MRERACEFVGERERERERERESIIVGPVLGVAR
jgi:hypothetical protein